MSLLAGLMEQAKHLFKHELFLRINKIRKPKEVLVIVARSRKPAQKRRPY
jgi:hypothetical protein